MKKVYFTVGAIGVVAVLTIAGISLMEPKQQADNTWDGVYEVGDFVEYYYNHSSTGNEVWRKTVTSANDTCVNYSWDSTRLGNNSGQLFAISGVDEFKDRTPFGFGRAVEGPSLHNVTVTYLGKVDVSTKWGVLSCEHYNMTYQNSGMQCDELLYNGVVVRFYGEYPDSGLWVSEELIDTNLEEMTNQ